MFTPGLQSIDGPMDQPMQAPAIGSGLDVHKVEYTHGGHRGSMRPPSSDTV